MKIQNKISLLTFLVISFINLNLNPCAIMGYIGSKLCKQFIIDGLSKLEYRGYDSAGIAYLSEY